MENSEILPALPSWHILQMDQYSSEYYTLTPEGQTQLKALLDHECVYNYLVSSTTKETFSTHLVGIPVKIKSLFLRTIHLSPLHLFHIIERHGFLHLNSLKKWHQLEVIRILVSANLFTSHYDHFKKHGILEHWEPIEYSWKKNPETISQTLITHYELTASVAIVFQTRFIKRTKNARKKQLELQEHRRFQLKELQELQRMDKIGEEKERLLKRRKEREFKAFLERHDLGLLFPKLKERRISTKDALMANYVADTYEENFCPLFHEFKEMGVYLRTTFEKVMKLLFFIDDDIKKMYQKLLSQPHQLQEVIYQLDRKRLYKLLKYCYYNQKNVRFRVPNWCFVNKKAATFQQTNSELQKFLILRLKATTEGLEFTNIDETIRKVVENQPFTVSYSLMPAAGTMLGNITTHALFHLPNITSFVLGQSLTHTMVHTSMVGPAIASTVGGLTIASGGLLGAAASTLVEYGFLLYQYKQGTIGWEICAYKMKRSLCANLAGGVATTTCVLAGSGRRPWSPAGCGQGVAVPGTLRLPNLTPGNRLLRDFLGDPVRLVTTVKPPAQHRRRPRRQRI